MDTPLGYEAMAAVYNEAMVQAAFGKGSERHGVADVPVEQQQSALISRWVGLGYPIGQAVKKALETSKMLTLGTWDNTRAEHELLGSINYLALAVVELRRRESA
jgi:hypothetical protein